MIRPESEFTGSRNPDCPHPQRWTAPDVHATECEVTELVAAWVRALQPDLVVETGSYHGHTTLAIAQAMKRNGHGRLVSLEIDPGLVDLARQRVSAYPHVEILCEDSLQWTPPSPIGFAWFDSAIPNRELEFRRYFPWLRGAIVGFHDTGRHHRVVRAAVEKLAGEGLLTPLFLNTPRGVAFAQVAH